MNKNLCVSAVFAGASFFTAGAFAQYGAPEGEWHYWGGDAGSTRYSALDQINKENVKDLKIAWRWQSLPHGDRQDSNLKATPLMIDGVLYTPTGVHQAAAINPKTGETIWTFSPTPADIGGRAPTSSSRSLAYWTDGKEKRLFHNTLDGRLISIDAKTGKADLKFGKQGAVWLKENLADRDVPFVGSSSPAIVVGDVVIAQVVTYITSPMKTAPPGHIRGYDVHTGKLLWTFHTIPQAGEFGNETWEKESWKYTGNTGVWSMISVDPETGYIYLPIEAPSHDFYGGQRLGDNLFSQSLVCLDGKTGERVWHFQMVHHGVWDYDPPAAPILHDITIDGVTIPAVTQLTKQGMSFVFNRKTGEPVWPIEEREVPASDTPGERTSPTQPFPTKPEYYVPHGYSEDHLIDFTPELRAQALEIANNYVRGPIYTPPSRIIEGGTQGTWVQPGYGGGSNWNGGAFDPTTSQMFVPNRSTAYVAALGKTDPDLTNWDYLRMPTGSIPGPQGLPITKPPYSFVTATDMNEGAHTWSIPIGGAPDWIRNHPALRELELNFSLMGEVGVRPSPLATATLLFLAESGNLSGDPGGPMFRAYDKLTGEIIAELRLPERASGAPMTYLHDGRQYIVIAVASADFPAELVALALPSENPLLPSISARPSPPPGEPPTNDTQPTPPAITSTQEELENGQVVYAQSCAMCHGPAGEGIPGGPPRVTGLTNYDTIRQRIEQGGIEMPAMSSMLTEQQIDHVTRYIAAGLTVETNTP